MPPTPTLVQPLPLDADGILALAARSMFQLFSTMSQGMFLADRAGRIVWVNEGYQRFLPDLGVASVDMRVLGMTSSTMWPRNSSTEATPRSGRKRW